MSLAEELVTPVISRMSRLQWVGGSVVLGFFLGFVDTLLIAALLGYMGLQVPAYFGVPTTFTGYFFTGAIIGKLAPAYIQWEAPVGILICVFLLMLGLVGLSGQGVLSFLLHFVIVPAIAVGICYLGLRVSRKKNKALAQSIDGGLAG